MKPSPSRKRRRGPLTQDFELLASRYSDFATEWSSVSASSDNNDHRSLASKSTPSFQLSLTRALLDFHFSLKLPSLPENRLCPPVPNRWFYCEWILQELMPSLTNPNHFSTGHRVQNVGLDIGTGASAIYSLLLAAHDTKLRMLASEVDPISLASAKTNIDTNNLQDRITLIDVGQTYNTSCNVIRGPLLQALEEKSAATEYLDFVLTNPPFFEENPPDRADGRARTPMTQTESIYSDGGEVGWVLDILRDSLTTRTRIGWYTTMLSKKTSFVKLKRILLDFLGPGHVRSTELEIGSTMTRWFLAWTYYRPYGQTTAVETRRINFDVQGNEGAAITLDKVADRLKTYCTSIPGWDLACSKDTNTQKESVMCLELIVTENNPSIPSSYMVEEKAAQLPDRVSMDMSTETLSLTAKDWLPAEGHFVMRFRLVVEQIGSSEKQNAVKVSVHAYGHSSHGGKAIEKILSRVEGEVTRTNRRWRRQLARQNQQQTSA